MASRIPHAFDNLYYMVKVRKQSGTWNNIPGESPAQTATFRICTLANDSFYGTAPDSVYVVDWGLKVSNVSNGFSGLISDNPLAKISNASFSIDNLELFYHRLSEANGDDLNTFYGAEVEIYACNGLVPGMFWDGANWTNENGVVYPTQLPNPGVNYPTNDQAFKLFTGTINKIDFSTKETKFSALSVADKINTKFGTLSQTNSDPKSRGDIIPIVFGNWGQSGDLAPLILERDSQDVPRLFLGTEPNKDVYTVRLYDKVSELDYRVRNSIDIDADNEIGVFQNDEAAANLQKNITDEVDDWDNGSELTNELNAYFPTNDGQKVYNLSGELVAFHHWLPRFTGEDRAASRGWAGSSLAPHISTEELFEIDSNIQKANAIIEIPLLPSELYLIDDSLDGGARSSGSFESTLKNDDSSLQDVTNSNYFLKVGAEPVSGDGLIQSNVAYHVNFKEFGFDGTVLSYSVSISILGVKDSLYSSAGVKNQFLIFDSYVPGSAIFTVNLNDGVNTEFSSDSYNLKPYFATASDLKSGFDVQLVSLVNDSEGATTPTYIQWNYLKGSCTLEVFAENGLWFWRGLGRQDGAANLIEKPADIYSNVLEKELKATAFQDDTTNRTDWKAAPAIYGSQPNWRDFAKEFLLNTGCASYVDASGNERLFDLEAKTNPDHLIQQEWITADNGLQDINYSFTDRMDMFNEFIIKFRYNPANGQYLNVIRVNKDLIESTDDLVFYPLQDAPNLRLRCEKAGEYLGLASTETKQFVFESKHIRDQRTAEQLLRHFVKWKTTTKALVSIGAIIPSTYNIEIGEQVEFNNVMGIPNKIKNARYVVTAKDWQPNQNGKTPKLKINLTEIPD